MTFRTLIVTIIANFCLLSAADAQRSDSTIVRQLCEEGIRFSDNNSVTLLMSGQEKFDYLFCQITQARSSVHL